MTMYKGHTERALKESQPPETLCLCPPPDVGQVRLGRPPPPGQQLCAALRSWRSARRLCHSGVTGPAKSSDGAAAPAMLWVTARNSGTT